MNDPSTRDAIVARQQKLIRQQTHTGLVSLVVTLACVAALFILPQLTPPYDVMSMGLGSAAGLTALLVFNPKSLRSRGGSLVPAWFLVAALWLLAVVSTVVSLIG